MKLQPTLPHAYHPALRRALLTRNQLAVLLHWRFQPPQTIDPRDRDFRNGKFSDPKAQFNRAPGKLLVETIRGRKPGRALDLGMGERRNTI